MTILSGVLLAWKFLYLLRGTAIPPQKWVTVIAVLGVVGVVLTKHSLIGEDSATAALAIIAGSKLLETNRYRDVMVTLVLCFILLMTLLLVSQSLGTMAFLFVDVLLLLQLFLQLHPSDTSLFSFKVAGRLLLMVLPVWLLLFIVFPRFTVGFWRREAPVTQTGFSDEMNPGTIGRVVESDELAFRVKFKELAIRPDDLYWRGAVLSVSDGLHWSKTPRALPLEDLDPVELIAAKTIEYQIFLEPFFQHWLFALDFFNPETPIQIGGQFAKRKNGGISESGPVLVSRVSYEASAVTTPLRQVELSDLERLTYLQLPPSLDPEIKELALKLRAPSGGAPQSIDRLSNWFRKEKFFYTLNPGRTASLSAFLFASKVGFCEHYAAAAAVLLRAMGFPSRVVIGFQGAERNELGDYWIVRNRNGHAWAETWIDQGTRGGHWQRVDIVSVITPLRVMLGADYFRIAAQLPAGATQIGNDRLQQMDQGAWGKIQDRLRLTVDAVEMQWIRFLLAYDFEFQQRLISRIGIQNATRMTLAAILASLLGGILLLLKMMLQRRKGKADPVVLEWRKLCLRLARAGVERKPPEGPLDFINRARRFFPKQESALAELRDLYLLLRYGRIEENEFSEKFKKFRLGVRRFNFVRSR